MNSEDYRLCPWSPAWSAVSLLLVCKGPDWWWDAGKMLSICWVGVTVGPALQGSHGLEEGWQQVPLMQALARYTCRPAHLPALAGQDGRPSLSFAQLPAFQRKWLGGRTCCRPGRPIDQTGPSPCTGGSSRRCFDSSRMPGSHTEPQKSPHGPPQGNSCWL